MAFKRNIRKSVFVLLILTVALVGCLKSPESDNNLKALEFHLTLDEDIYLDTIYGQTPQIAIWLENPENGQIRNVWVSHRTGKNEWVGKSYCDVSLPYWQSLNGRTKKDKLYKVLDDDEVHAFTMATPKNDFIKASAWVPKGSKWNYYIEINVSGDFNEIFTSRHPDGYPDLQGNGQPSIIYKGSILAVTGQKDVPEIIGRTEQWQPADEIIENIDEITTAGKLLKKVRVTCGSLL